MLRVAVVDVGSTSAHVDVVELRRSRPPGLPVTVKHKVSLSRELGADGLIREESLGGLTRAVRRAADTATQHGADELVAFATSVVRDAPNCDAVLDRVAEASGVRLGVLSPRQEARLTYEGARQWARPDRHEPLMVVDIGGGTMEIAFGTGPRARRAVSAPLGARRVTLADLPGDPPRPRDVARLRKRVRREVAAIMESMAPLPADVLCVAASRIFAQLAEATAGEGAVATTALDLEKLRGFLPALAEMTVEERALLPGVSRSRAPYILAGAVLAESLMDAADVRVLPVCPWGLREGITMRLQAGLAGDQTPSGLEHLRQPA